MCPRFGRLLYIANVSRGSPLLRSTGGNLCFDNTTKTRASSSVEHVIFKKAYPIPRPHFMRNAWVVGRTICDFIVRTWAAQR